MQFVFPAQKDEARLMKPKVAGDVADKNVGHAVTVEVTEVDPHAVEGVSAEDTRARRGQRPLAVQSGKPELAGPRPVVQQSIRSEVLDEVEFRKQVAIEVGRP